MHSNEHAMLEKFLNELVQARGVEKNPQANAMIKRAVDRQPDADYLLVQRSLILEQALRLAKARIADLERTQQQTDRSFVDIDASAPPASANTRATVSLQQTTMAAAALGSPVTSNEPSRGSGPPSFLGQAAATAAGVAGGAFLFEGLESMLRPQGGSPPGHETQSFLPEDVTINNYYQGHEHQADNRSSPLADAESDDDTASLDDDADLF